MGFSAHMYLSNKKLLSNYYATILNSPAFFPFPHSKTLFLENLPGTPVPFRRTCSCYKTPEKFASEKRYLPFSTLEKNWL